MFAKIINMKLFIHLLLICLLFFCSCKGFKEMTITDIHAVLYTGKEDTETFMKEIKMLSYLSTRNQWGESVLIPYTDSWFYTRLVITKNSCTSYTATGNYDNNKGKLIQTYTKPVPVTTGRIGLGFGDVYSGNSSYFILGEATIQTR